MDHELNVKSATGDSTGTDAQAGNSKSARNGFHHSKPGLQGSRPGVRISRIAMIEIRNISKSYGGLQVLKGINLYIPRKKVVTVVGASGAGKSTLLHILGTLDSPDTGEILYDGENISAYSPNKLANFRNSNIGFVFQFHHLLPEFTALENICLPAWIKGVRKKEAEAKAWHLLEIMGLRQRAAHKPAELSGGEQQRTAVARALINSPKVVLADEPSGNLDTNTKNELHRLFFSLRDELGQTFVIVTHDDELANMADQKIRLCDGTISRATV